MTYEGWTVEGLIRIIYIFNVLVTPQSIPEKRRDIRVVAFCAVEVQVRLASIIPDSSAVAEDDGAEHLTVFSRFLPRRTTGKREVCLFRRIPQKYYEGRRRRTSQTTTGTKDEGNRILLRIEKERERERTGLCRRCRRCQRERNIKGCPRTR